MSVCEVTQLWVNQSDLHDITAHQSVIDTDSLQAGEVLLQTESFGFSANNITYAALGHSMGYWGFFNAPDGYGIVPVWGFAVVAASNHPDVAVGEKLFGYLPMASHWVVAPGKVTDFGFHDKHPQRKSISPVYDNYLRCAKDPGYNPSRETWQLNFRPLFMTSFVLDDFVGEHLNHDTLILSSASSKTAFGTAHLLMKHKANRQHDYKVVGLTSASNVEFTESLGCYDAVYSYDDLAKISGVKSAWLLDFAANGTLMENLSTALGEALSTITLIGATDWDASQKPNKKALDAEIFFAPAQVKKRTEEWGQQGFLGRYSEAWQSFAVQVAPFMHPEEVTGVAAMSQLYKDTLSGKADTKALNTVTF